MRAAGAGYQMAGVTVYQLLLSQFEKEMHRDEAKIMATLVSQYVMGKNLDHLQKRQPDALRARIALLKKSVPQVARRVLREQKDIQTIALATVRLLENVCTVPSARLLAGPVDMAQVHTLTSEFQETAPSFDPDEYMDLLKTLMEVCL